MVIDLPLLRLLQLVSPGLPIGMFCYSQGLERAVHDAWIGNAEQADEWLRGILHNNLARTDAPLLARLYDAWFAVDLDRVTVWSQTLLAYRETAELRAEDKQTGQALARLLAQLDMPEAADWQKRPDTTLAALFALAAVRWRIDKAAAVNGYLWAWLENQVLCAVKLVPLGQVAGQQLLHGLATDIPRLAEQALRLSDAQIGAGSFGLALASSRHETQYSRLFRS
ncbi:urease accessory protein UreF [Methylomonas rhizoryzae]|uniref:urease accessory protein UreF n=1 Tax=Methylomonas rhizoryzae TaxID=2608981 RepID=UPI001232E913|nr:urease accessory UreF family protein [Methylomonas rhizoryzae]